MTPAPPVQAGDGDPAAEALARAIADERERIAHEFDAAIISRLLSAILRLQGTATLLDGRAAARVSEIVDELDSIVIDARAAIFRSVGARRTDE